MSDGKGLSINLYNVENKIKLLGFLHTKLGTQNICLSTFPIFIFGKFFNFNQLYLENGAPHSVGTEMKKDAEFCPDHFAPPTCQD